MAIGLIGIILALILFLGLVYKGCSSYWVAALCAILVAVTNGMNVVEAITGSYLPGIVDMILKLFSVIFLGAILGKIYADTGAAASIAKTLTNAFVVKRQGKSQVRAAIIVLLVVSAVCTMGGIDGYVLTFTLFPICMVVSEMCDIPRRFVPGMFCLNCAFMTAPGAPQIYNIMGTAAMKSQIPVFEEQGAMAIVGELAGISPLSAPIPGLIATIIIATCGCATLISMINKAKANGEHFDFGPLTHMQSEMEGHKQPHFVLSLLPLAMVFVLYTILRQDIFLALLAGILVALATMFPYLPRQDRGGSPISLVRSLVGTVNGGAEGYPNALLSVSTPAGLAGVITATAAFGAVVGFFSGLPVPALVLTIIVVCVVVAITSAPPVALMVAIPMVLGIISGPLIATAANAAAVVLPVSAAGIYRTAILAASTFETLPINGLIVLGLSLTRTTHKEAYKPMFLMTVAYTLLGTVVCAALCMLFPALAV